MPHFFVSFYKRDVDKCFVYEIQCIQTTNKRTKLEGMDKMYPEISTTELESQLKNGKSINLVDVREPDEWQAGHIKEARSIPLSELQERIDELKQGDQEIVLVCRSGGRSGKACDFLYAQGYKVVNVTGGMLQWPGEVVYGD